ncbi:MAG: hypothetical protein HY395_02050 [Candidatus Doudnabacteria bacterium]|nr:hypothetical protein [Candidatus Doudnabacteria bacterium]
MPIPTSTIGTASSARKIAGCEVNPMLINHMLTGSLNGRAASMEMSTNITQTNAAKSNTSAPIKRFI